LKTLQQQLTLENMKVKVTLTWIVEQNNRATTKTKLLYKSARTPEMCIMQNLDVPYFESRISSAISE